MWRRSAAVASWLALVLALGLGVAPLSLPAPSNGSDAAFSATRAMERIRRIATEPHPIGTDANRQVRDEIVAELRALGLEPMLQTVPADDYYGGSGRSVAVVNVAARIGGAASTGAVALVGHYDTVPTSLGANDDGSAVTVILETARAVLAGPPLANDLILLLTDGEEPAPRYGSEAFVAEHPWASDVAFVINLEALGSGGPAIPTGLNGPSGWIMGRYAEAAPRPAAYSYLTATAGLIGGSNTDFAPFKAAGTPGIELAYLHGSPIYHTLADATDRVSLRTLQHEGDNVLAFTQLLGGLDLGSPPGGGDVVFFMLGGALVQHPAGLVLPIVLLAGIGLLVAWWRYRAIRRGLASAGTTLLAILAAALASVAIWVVLAGWRTTMGVEESYLYLLLLLAGSAGIVMGAARLLRRRIGPAPDAIGVVTVWWGLGLLATLLSPGLGYLFAWPALAGTLVLVVRSPDDEPWWWRPLSLALVGGIALVLLAPAIDTFYQLAQPRPGNTDSQILPIIVIPVSAAVLVFELIRTFAGSGFQGSSKEPAP